MNRLASAFFLLVLPLVLAGCNHINIKPEALLSSLTGPGKLKVGIAGDAPPLAYKKDGTLIGLETRFAAGLARSTGKTLELVELPRQELTQALLDKKIDLIMAGLTAADAQEHHLTATAPYLITGQVPLVHLDAYKRLVNAPQNLAEPQVRLGVVAGSPGEVYLKEVKPKGTITRFASVPEGVQALLANTIDALLADLPTNCYYAALYVDQGLTPGATPLTREELVFAVRPDDQEMLKAANTYLAAIQQNGELNKLLEHSIPFYTNTAYSPKK